MPPGHQNSRRFGSAAREARGRACAASWPAVLVVLFLAAAAPLAAQSITLGGLEGAVRDSARAPVVGALVSLTDQTTGVRRSAGVDSHGGFAFRFLPPGNYEVMAEQIGYTPVVVRDVRVEPGTQPVVEISLRGATLPVTRLDTVRWAGPAFASQPGASEGLTRPLVQRFTTEPYDLASFGSVISAAGGDWGLLGLPGFATGVVIDGLPYPVARSSWLPVGGPIGPAFPGIAFEEAAAQLAPVDVEWGDLDGGAVSAVTRRGTRKVTVQAFGDGAPGALTDSRFFDAGSLTQDGWTGGLVVSGPALRDTSNFVVGVEGGRTAQARPPAWSQPTGAAIAAAAMDSAGQSLADYLAPRVVRLDRASGFGRLNWLIGPRQQLDAWASAGWVLQHEPGVGPLAAPGLGSQMEATDLTAGASLTSQLGHRVAHEFRLGAVHSQRDYTAGPVPATYFASGEAAGTDPTVPGSFTLTGVHAQTDLLVQAGGHEFKLGIAAGRDSYSQTYLFGSGGAFYVTDAAGLGSQRGAYVGVTGTAAPAQFAVSQYTGFLQDRWTFAKGYAFFLGLRYGLETVPWSSIPHNKAWLSQTGLPNDIVPHSFHILEPRFGFDWRIGGEQNWHVRGGAGIYYGQVNPALLAEAITEAGQNQVHRGVGPLGAWPAAPDATVAPDVGARLTLLGPNLRPPRSAKASLGIARRIGRSGAIEVGLDVRHTDFLPRRHDVNRPLGPGSQDQYGRPIYGTLIKEGSIVALDPLSPRRFSGFELVSAIDRDGYSDYAGVNVRLVQPVSRFVRLYGSYTYSRTTDNWLSGLNGGPYAQLTPFPDSLDGADWADGTGDLDVPHRVAAGVEIRPRGDDALTVGVRFRWQSGAPFTPGLAPGVDANGDGSFTNDPAFVDDTLPGMAPLLAAWPCLRAQAGRFAQRNSCRDPGASTLDARVGITPVRRYPLEIWVEAFNLTEPAVGTRDHALYTVDPAAPLTVDSAGHVTIPFVANPDFGQLLRLATPGRTVRIGVRVNY